MSYAAALAWILASTAIAGALWWRRQARSQLVEHDATRRQAEGRIARLETERDDLTDILSTMSEGILVADGDDRVRLINAAFRDLFDLGDDVVGREVGELELPPLLRQAITRALRDRQTVSGDFETSHLTHPGLAVQVSPRPDGQGAVVVARDISELLRLGEIRRDLVANVSHELKTPLTAIRGYAETLASGALEQPRVARSFTGSILEQCGRLEDLLRDLLTLSRFESQHEPRHRQEVDLLSLAQRALEILEPGIHQRGIDVEIDGTTKPPTILGDSDQLERLFLNLIENAVKYNREDGQIRIRFLHGDDEVVVEIEDSGIGIPEDALERIFERFYRVDKGRARDQGGTGLGLSIVKHAARSHGGEVEIESRLGRGSLFRVRLPRLQRSPGDG